MRVQLVDPAAYSPPYDHALAAALARGGAEVELATTRFAHGDPPPVEGFTLRDDAFYKRAAGRTQPASRQLTRLTEHLPGMWRHRRNAADRADVVHYQWLTFESLDSHLLARGVPRVFTAHNVVRREKEKPLRRVVGRVDAVITHTASAGAALSERAGADPDMVHVIPHGVLDHIAGLEAAPLPPELAAVDKPVVLAFGIIRDYKGHDVLVDAFADIDEAELWIAGHALMDTSHLTGPNVRLMEGYVEPELAAAMFRRADIVVLPYRRIDQSGVLQTALPFGKALVLSDVGGFTDLARDHGAARLVPAGDADALRAAISELIADPAARAELEEAARKAAAGAYSWDTIAARTLEVYEGLLR